MILVEDSILDGDKGDFSVLRGNYLVSHLSREPDFVNWLDKPWTEPELSEDSVV